MRRPLFIGAFAFLFLPFITAAASLTPIVTTAAVLDYSANPYILHVTGQDLGGSVPIVMWNQQPLVVMNFTPAPNPQGFQTFDVGLAGPPTAGSYSLVVTPLKSNGKPDNVSAQFEVTLGNAGPVGPMGPMGPTGPQGLMGPIGFMGPQGPAGRDGAQGPAGAVGAQGPKGDLGAQGAAGAVGAVGAQGPRGEPGTDGLPGKDGAAGPTGVTGATGATGPGMTGRVYRWKVFNTYNEGVGWLFSNLPDLFGGISPQLWTDGNATADMISANKDYQRALFTQKGYPGKNALVVSSVFLQYSSTNGQIAAVLFRIKNSTASPIQWTPVVWYSSYYGWSERASAALNGVLQWAATTNTSGAMASFTMSIPESRTSTFIFVSGAGPAYGLVGSQLRNTVLGFINDSLALPAGLEFVDDLETATGGFEQ